MGKIFSSLFDFFAKRKIIFFLVLLLSSFLIGFYAFKINLEEDITKMMPTDERIERLNTIFTNSKFLDRLVVTVSLSDSFTDGNPLKLIETTDSIVAKLKHIDSSLIKEITFKLEDDAMANVYNTFINHLPIFLEEQDYETLNNLISEAQLDSTLEKNYKTLLSPASFILKKKHSKRSYWN